MRILLDSNILTRSVQTGHPQQQIVLDVLAILGMRGDELCIVPQNLYEFWVVATRPVSVKGLGLTTTQAHGELNRIKSLFYLLPDSPAVYFEWERLVVLHAVSGKNAHDARITATLNVHGIPHLLTFNGADFKRFSGLTVIEPHTVTPPPVQIT